MELDVIRKQLDQLDQSLDYIILLRLSLAILVGEVKEEKHLPIVQSAREEKIYASQKQFAEQTGADTDLLTHVYKELITAAIKMEKDLGRYRLEINATETKTIEQELQKSNLVLGDFIAYMDSVKARLQEKGMVGDKVLSALAEYYRNSFTDTNKKEL